MRITSCLLTAFVLTGSAANGQESTSPLRHLPENTMAIAHVNVGALLKSNWGKSALDEVLNDKELSLWINFAKAEFGIDPRDVDTMTLFMLDLELLSDKEAPNFRTQRFQFNRGPSFTPPPPPSDTGPPAIRRSGMERDYVYISYQPVQLPDVPLLLVTLRKPVDRKLMMKKKFERTGRDLGVQFVDDQSFVLGADYAVVRFAASTSEKESDLVRQLLKDTAAPILAGYRLTPQLKAALLNNRQNLGPLSMVFPLLNVNHVTVAIEPGKALDVKIRLQAANERQANLAAQAVKTLLAFGLADWEASIHGIEESKAGLDAQGKQQAAAEVARYREFLKMAAGARVEQRQTDVHVALQLPAQPKHLVPLLQGILNFGASPRATSVSH